MPVAKKKTEYVIPLITKTKWRTADGESGNSPSGEGQKGDETGNEVKPMSAEEELEKEAVQAVWRGGWWALFIIGNGVQVVC